MFKRVFSLIIKEFLAAVQDRKSRFVLIVPPLVQLLIFAYAATLDVSNVSVGILNRDEGKYSFELVERLRGSPTFTHIFSYDSPEELKQGIDLQKVPCVLHFDETFSRDLLAGEGGKVQVILDGRKSNSTQIILGYLDAIVNRFNQDIKKKEGKAPGKVEVISRNWYNPNLIYTWFTVPGLVGTLSMMTGLIVTAMTVARERELGTFDQLLVSPLTPMEILVGKTIPGVVFGMVQGSLMALAAVYFFEIPFTGCVALFYMSLLIFIASVVGIGLFLSSISNTQQQALLYTFVFLAPAVTLSGFATPVENMPIFFQKITDLNPLKHFLVIARGVFLKELSYKEVMHHIYPLFAIATFNLGGAALFFKRRIS